MKAKWFFWLGGALVLFLLARTETAANVGKAIVIYASRGLRLNNPGNIRHSAANQWLGMSAIQPDESFVAFDEPRFGVRALGRILQTYERRGVHTIARLISTWAPPSENDTAAYVSHVSRTLHLSPDDAIDVSSYLPQLAAAIIKHENGVNPYSDAELKQWVYS